MYFRLSNGKLPVFICFTLSLTHNLLYIFLNRSAVASRSTEIYERNILARHFRFAYCKRRE